MADDVPAFMAPEVRLKHMLSMCKVVRRTGEATLKMKPEEMHDMVVVDNHSFSNVDAVAGSHLRTLVAQLMPKFADGLMEECDIARALRNREALKYPLLICDAVEGSTNAKRGLSAFVRRPIFAGTSMLLIEGVRMTTVAASAFYDFASGCVFSSVRGESGSFLSFLDEKILEPRGDFVNCHGDSKLFAVVAAYSHDNVDCPAEIMRALLANDIRLHGGSRSSAQDLLDILCNQVDSYIDLRALFPGNTNSRDEALHVWDVGGLLPFMDGLGYVITDHHGKSWQDQVLGEKLPLIVSRPKVAQQIINVVGKLSFVAEPEGSTNVLPLTKTS